VEKAYEYSEMAWKVRGCTLEKYGTFGMVLGAAISFLFNNHNSKWTKDVCSD